MDRQLMDKCTAVAVFKSKVAQVKKEEDGWEKRCNIKKEAFN